jgi:hypothetical protein
MAWREINCTLVAFQESELVQKRSYSLLGVLYYESLDDSMDACPEDVTWQAMRRLEDEQPSSFAIL